jgi:hypothetical protein
MTLLTVDPRVGACRWQPIHLAASTGQLSIVELCVSRGVDVNAAVSGGSTAVHIACSCGYAHIVRWIAAHGATAASLLAKAGEPLRTPLQFAVHAGQVDVAFVLLREVKVSVAWHDAADVMNLVCRLDRSRAAQVVALLQLVRDAVIPSSDTDNCLPPSESADSYPVLTAGRWGETPLHCAVKAQNEEAVRYD